MAEGTASLLEFYAKGNDGGAVSVAQRVAQSWRAACPGDEVMHGVQHIGMVADPEAFGGSADAPSFLSSRDSRLTCWCPIHRTCCSSARIRGESTESGNAKKRRRKHRATTQGE